jgi:hypothetical protein
LSEKFAVIPRRSRRAEMSRSWCHNCARADDRRRELAARLQIVDGAVHELNPRAVLTDLRQRLSDWRSILFGDPVSARGLVRQLIVGRLKLVPDVERQGFRFTGTGTLVPLLAGVIPGLAAVLSQNGSSPAGFEPALPA